MPLGKTITNTLKSINIDTLGKVSTDTLGKVSTDTLGTTNQTGPPMRHTHNNPRPKQIKIIKGLHLYTGRERLFSVALIQMCPAKLR